MYDSVRKVTVDEKSDKETALIIRGAISGLQQNQPRKASQIIRVHVLTVRDARMGTVIV